jgi:site-specific DNA-adenine methylase
MRYPGGKGGSGVYQKIINLIPPHETYIEPFVGGGNIFERKSQAATSILIDRDPCIEQLWKQRCGPRGDVEIYCGNAIQFLKERQWVGNEFVYLDPPYVLSTRTKRKYTALKCRMTNTVSSYRQLWR